MRLNLIFCSNITGLCVKWVKMFIKVFFTWISLNIQHFCFSDEPLILEGPEHPVSEGENLTLHCRFWPPLSSSLTRFYGNGVLVGSSSTGRFTVRSVSKSDEGFYKCNASGVGESAETWLAVRGEEVSTWSLSYQSINKSINQLYLYSIFHQRDISKCFTSWKTNKKPVTGITYVWLWL